MALSGWAFPVEVDERTGRIRTVEDNDAVAQDIRLILQTERGERKMRPNFGAGLNRFMFQNISLSLAKGMSDAIVKSINLWEKHVTAVNAAVEQSVDNSAVVQAEIQYLTDLGYAQLGRIEEELHLNRAER